MIVTSPGKLLPASVKSWRFGTVVKLALEKRIDQLNQAEAGRRASQPRNPPKEIGNRARRNVARLTSSIRRLPSATWLPAHRMESPGHFLPLAQQLAF